MPYPAMPLSVVHALLTAPASMLEVVEAEVMGQRQRIWKNAPPTMREIFLAGRAHGAADFLVYEDERATFEALARASVAFAHELQKQGVAKGDRVAIAMRNLPEWPAAFFGAMLAGAVVVPLNAWSTGAELQYMLEDCGAVVAVVDPERFDRIASERAACPALRRVYVSRLATPAPDALRFEDVVGTTAAWAALPLLDLPDVALAPDDDATIFYTSGTTGKPKGALGTHRNACSTLFARAYAKAAAALRRGEAPAAADPGAAQESTLLSVPFFHVTGCFSTLIPAFFAGVKIATMRRWDAGEALKLIERERINGAGGVPTIAWQLIEHPEPCMRSTIISPVSC